MSHDSRLCFLEADQLELQLGFSGTDPCHHEACIALQEEVLRHRSREPLEAADLHIVLLCFSW